MQAPYYYGVHMSSRMYCIVGTPYVPAYVSQYADFTSISISTDTHVSLLVPAQPLVKIHGSIMHVGWRRCIILQMHLNGVN